MRYLVVLAAVAFVVGCGGSSDADEPAASARELFDRMTAGGVQCANYAEEEEPDRYTVVTATCRSGSEKVVISTHADGGAQRNWRGWIETWACATNVSSVPVVAGDRWSIAPDGETLARQIKDAVGGKVSVIECD